MAINHWELVWRDQKRRQERARTLTHPLIHNVTIFAAVLGVLLCGFLLQLRAVRDNFTPLGLGLAGVTLISVIWDGCALHCELRKLNRLLALLDEPLHHGDTIGEVMRSLRQQPYEYLALFTADGYKLAETTTYERYHVELTCVMQEMIYERRAAILVHTHPHDSCFSPEDWRSLGSLGIPNAILLAPRIIFLAKLSGRKLPAEAIDVLWMQVITTDPNRSLLEYGMLMAHALALQFGFELCCVTKLPRYQNLWQSTTSEAQHLIGTPK